MMPPIRFASSHQSSLSNSPITPQSTNLLVNVDEIFDLFEAQNQTAQPLNAQPECSPAKLVNISLSKLYQQIKNLPKELAHKVIPKKQLISDILEEENSPLNEDVQIGRKRVMDINLASMYTLNSNKENNLYLCRSLQRGNMELFNALLKNTPLPELGSLFEITAIQGNSEAFSKLLKIALQSKYSIPKSILQTVAESGRQDQLSSLLTLSRLPRGQRIWLWQLAQKQKAKIKELRSLKPEERQHQYADFLLDVLNNDNRLWRRDRRNLLALIQAGVDLNTTRPDSIYPPIFNAIKTNNTALVKILLQAGVQADQINKKEWGITALSVAANHYHINPYLLRLLIQNGEDVNSASRSGTTPLHTVAEIGHVESINVLLAAGANIDKENDWEETPLFKAAQAGKLEAVKVLLDAGANIKHESTHDCSHSKTVLDYAAGSRDTRLIKALIKAGADVSKGTPLFEAIKNKDLSMVKALLEAGADPNISRAFFNRSLSALAWAQMRGGTDVIELLREHGARSAESSQQ